MADILVVADQVGGELKKSTFATLGFARKLAAAIDGSYDILVVGKGVRGAAEALTGYGAGTVYVIDGDAWASHLAPTFANAIIDAMEAAEAGYVVGSTSTAAKDVLPRVAAAIEAGMVADCVGLVDGGDEVLFKRPMFAGNVIATVRANTEDVVISVRTADFDAAAPTGGASPIKALDADPGDPGMRFIGFDATESERPELTDADIVVSGGRGLKDGPTFYQVMEPLADVLGAAIGASRAAVDSWEEVPNDMQVGQTGKVVAPKLYIAVAVSGAIQHLAGMKNSKTIVAINKDAEAPIFQVADYGLVADAFKAVPELVEKLRALK